jgi:hypothetical protein
MECKCLDTDILKKNFKMIKGIKFINPKSDWKLNKKVPRWFP